MSARWRQKLAELIYQLRIEHSSPARQGAAVGFGTFVGCLPVYGLHLPLCILAARLLRLNKLLMYLAAYINNPVTALPITFAEIQLGHWLLHRNWLSLSIESLKSVSWLDFGSDLVVGSLVFATILGVVVGFGTFVWLERTKLSHEVGGLVERSARRYVGAGIHHWEFVRGKLRFDPLYLGLLRSGVVRSASSVVDVGCGRGIAFALLETAPELHDEQIWPAGWPAPPRELQMVGFDRSHDALQAARVALGQRASFHAASLPVVELPPADLILITDVLHYLPDQAQRELLAAVSAALNSGGRVLIREVHRDASWRFRLTCLAERLRAILRGRPFQRFYYRSMAEWRALLQAQGLDVSELSADDRTVFSNRLISAQRQVESGN
jgi:uncharacterized protein (DUF2062 family)/SAM-dependent methyltransferase